MRFLPSLFVGFTVFSSFVVGQDLDAEPPQAKHHYQSDVARLRKIVINSLYSHREVFLRELVSNANDALEKLRLTALTNKVVWDGSSPLNITIKAVKDEDGKGGRLIITDTGIGMTAEDLSTHLGTLAKSGTSEFLAKAEGDTDTSSNGNFIGAFGVGFYSSFLVANKVYVASVAAPSASNPNPSQNVFSSSADENDFAVYPDPRGNTLGRGTEITLVLKDDALEYLDQVNIAKLIAKHSGFSTTFPIYLWEQRQEQVPEEEEKPVPDTKADESDDELIDDDEAVIEEVSEEKEPKMKKLKTVTVEDWQHVNAQPPLWMRDPKNITSIEYELFYQATFKDWNSKPLAWHHFTGDSGSGVSFRALLYIPGKVDDDFWQQPGESRPKDIRLMVKRVFITSDFGDEGLPKWASFVKAVIDAEDLPLNVSRETLQNTSFLKQLKKIIMKRLIQMFQKMADEEPEKFAELQKNYGNVLKLGAVEDKKNREKLVPLLRYHTNQRNSTSLDEYVENKREGQKQIFYVSDMGKSAESLAKSVFIEKLHARGYEVLLLTEPLDEILFQDLKKWKGIPFQDAAKAGLKFGDEEAQEEEKEQREHLKEKFAPLVEWIKGQVGDAVRDVVVSDRLVTSPCAIVADAQGYTANVQRMLSAANNRRKEMDFMHEYAKRQKVLEINPRSPLIEGLLKRVEQLPTEEEGADEEAEDELKEVTSILLDGALVRSGFDVSDSDTFFLRVDRVLRRSLGVSETAPTDTTVKPAPPVNPEILDEFEYEPEPVMPVMPNYIPANAPVEDAGKPHFELPDDMKDKFKVEFEEIDEEGNPIEATKPVVAEQASHAQEPVKVEEPVTEEPVAHDEL